MLFFLRKNIFLLLSFIFMAHAAQGASQEIKVFFIGDSLSAGYGVNEQEAYPSLLGKKVNHDFNDSIKIINSSVSGSTSASAPSRIKWILKAKPKIVVLALGANDALRGISPESVQKNLSQAIELLQKENIEVLVLGMLAPPNYGKEYTKKFEQVYKTLEQKYKVKLMPFLLEGVAGEKSLNQNDGIHPNSEGHKKMSEKVYPYLKKVLENARRTQS